MCSDDKTVRVFNASERRQILSTVLDCEGRSIAMSYDGQHIAVGLKNAHFVILSAKDLTEVMCAIGGIVGVVCSGLFERMYVLV
jgi:hypothetical protein